MYFSGILVGLPLAKTGKVRALAVATAKRSPLAPEIPTIAESGLPRYEMTLWNAIFAPAATPKDIIGHLNAEIVKALQSRDVQERLAALGAAPGGGSPEDLGAYFKNEVEKFGKIVHALGLKME
jgi:tripartite-type tricarboxylate transporter receptor subunit TctC